MAMFNSKDSTLKLYRGIAQPLGRPIDTRLWTTRERASSRDRDRTIELCDADLEELAPTVHPCSEQHGDSWSIDVLVDCDTGNADLYSPTLTPLALSEPLPIGLGPDPLETRGLLWRILFRLGWVTLDDETVLSG